MKFCIEINNDTGFHTLAEGEYTLGGTVDCDILVADPGLDGANLQLIIESQKVYLSSSTDSRQLYYLDTPVQHIVFDRDFQVRFGAARISCLFEKGKKLNSLIPRLRSFFHTKWREIQQGDLRRLLVLLFLLFLVASYLLLRIPAQGQFAYFNHQEIVKRGLLLSRYLAEINRDVLKKKEYNLLRVLPVSSEEGVVAAMFTDNRGKVLAGGISGSEHAVVSKKLQKALAVKESTVETGESDRLFIFSPLIEDNQTLGMAVLVYDIEKAHILSVPTGSLLGLVLFGCLVLLGSLIAMWIARLFLNQIDELNDQLNIAIKNGEDRLGGATAPYKEMEQIRAGINRLLTYSNAALSSQSLSLASEAAIVPGEGEREEIAGKEAPAIVKEQDKFWLVIDPVSFLITDFSQKFSNTYVKSGARPGQHLVEMIDNPELIKVVSELIDPSSVTESVKFDTGETVLRVYAKRISKDEICIFLEEQDADS